MKQPREIKRVFPKCPICMHILAQCCCAASRSERDALAEYMMLRDQACELESHEEECRCNLDNFHTCDLCTESNGINHRMRGLLELWGDDWAMKLWSQTASQAEDL